MMQVVDPSSLAWAIVRLYVTTLICLVPLTACLLYSLLRLSQCNDASEASILCSLAGCALYGIVISSLWKEDMQGLSSSVLHQRSTNNNGSKSSASPISLKVFRLANSVDKKGVVGVDDGDDEDDDDNNSLLLPEARDMSAPCPICLEGYAEGNLVSCGEQCPHTFHAHCIGQWTELGHTNCPCCREGLLPQTKRRQKTLRAGDLVASFLEYVSHQSR